MTTRPKVVLVSSLYAPDEVGGAERVVRTIAESFTSTGVDSVVVTLTPEPTSRVDVVDGVTVHRISIPNRYWPFDQRHRGTTARMIWHARDAYNRRAAEAVGDVLDLEAPDVVHTHNIAGFSVGVWRPAVERRLPLVHTMHDQYLMCPRTTMFRDGHNCATQCGSCRVFTQPARWTRALPTVVTGPSRFILDRHVRHGWFRDRPRLVVRNAHVSDPSEPVRCSGGGAGPLRFGFLGRLAETKGLDPLLRAFRELPPGAAELLIGGTGATEYAQRLRGIAGDRRDVHWLGHVEPASLLERIDVLVVPSVWDDTAPLVVLEAFERGRPVIGADRGGIPELVGLGAGWIVDPDDRADLVERLSSCIDDRHRLAELGRTCRRAAAELTVEHMLDGYRCAYRAAGAPGF